MVYKTNEYLNEFYENYILILILICNTVNNY